MSSFDSQLQINYDSGDSLSFLQGMNQSAIIIPIIKSEAQLIHLEQNLQKRSKQKCIGYDVKRNKINHQNLPQKNFSKRKTKKMKWSIEQKKRYWEGCLDFMIQYPSLKISWSIQKPREPAFFQYIQKKVKTKSKLQCKCFDQTHKKNYFLNKEPFESIDIQQLVISFLSQNCFQQSIMQKIENFKYLHSHQKEEDNIDDEDQKQDNYIYDIRNRNSDLENCITNFTNQVYYWAKESNRHLGQLQKLRNKVESYL